MVAGKIRCVQAGPASAEGRGCPARTLWIESRAEHTVSDTVLFARGTNKVIQAEGLTKYYGDFAAIRDVSFDVGDGEILGFLGPNGAGKTTTMRILTGYMPPSRGRAVVAGFDVTQDSLEVRRRIGYLPEAVPLYPEMSVRGYLEFVARAREMDDGKSAVEWAMGLCRVEERAGQQIGQLSKGYRQRVGLAQALLHSPEVLVLDEPTLGLDPAQIIEVRELIKGLAGERTVILSTHILPEVSQICQRAVVIAEGRIVGSLPLGAEEGVEVRVSRGTRRLEAELRKVDGVEKVRGLGGNRYEVVSTAGVDVRSAIAKRVVERGHELLEMRPLGSRLEEAFLEITAKTGSEEGS